MRSEHENQAKKERNWKAKACIFLSRWSELDKSLQDEL